MLNPILLSLLMLISTSAFALIGGQPAKNGQGAGVVLILVRDNMDPENNNLCTATKIGVNVLLTAAHCLEDLKERSNNLGFTDNINIPQSGFESTVIRKVVIHPSYPLRDENDESINLEEIVGSEIGSDEIDLALVFLWPGSTFEKIGIREIDFKFVTPHSSVKTWGYGCQETANSMYGYRALRKFGKSSVLDKKVLNKDYGVLTQAVHRESKVLDQNTILTAGLNISSKAFSLCHGDSGGPLFKNGKLVGVNAFYLAEGMTSDGISPSGKSNVNIHQRLSAVKDWMIEELDQEK